MLQAAVSAAAHTMTQLGYTRSSEEHNPTALVSNAQRAERAGFDFLSISDHYHPWTSQQGNSPFVWNVLGAIAAATTKTMLDGEFYFGVGTGENLNEHIIGEGWPEHSVRLAMLEEAVDVIRSL